MGINFRTTKKEITMEQEKIDRIIKLYESALKDEKAVRMLKECAVRVQSYALAAELREIELSFPAVEKTEQKEIIIRVVGNSLQQEITGLSPHEVIGLTEVLKVEMLNRIPRAIKS